MVRLTVIHRGRIAGNVRASALPGPIWPMLCGVALDHSIRDHAGMIRKGDERRFAKAQDIALSGLRIDQAHADDINAIDGGLAEINVALGPDLNVFHHPLRAATPTPTGTVTDAGRGSTVPGEGEMH